MILYKVTSSIDYTQEIFNNSNDLKLYLLDQCSLGSKYFDNYIDTMYEELEIDEFIFKPSDVLKKVNTESYKELYSKILNQELGVFLIEIEKQNNFWFFNTFYIEIIK